MLTHPVIAESYATALAGSAAQAGDDPELSIAAVEGPELLRRFGAVSDGRSGQGRDHPVAVVLTLCAAAVLGGMRSFTAIAGWVADVPAEVLARLYARPARSPSKTTLWRVLTGADAAAVDAVVGAWLLAQATARTPRPPDPGADESPGEALVAVAVDAKTVRGALDANGAQVHLMAAATHQDSLVLAQVEVGVKTNEVRREAPCRIPDSVGRNLEDSSWVRWLTLSRKVTGTRACHGYRRSCPDVRSGASGNPRDTAKPGLAESQSPAMQLFIHRKWRLKPVPRSVSGYFVTGCNFQSVGRCPVRTFKGMSGTPKSRCYVRQGRTRDRLRGASPMATECS